MLLSACGGGGGGASGVSTSPAPPPDEPADVSGVVEITAANAVSLTSAVYRAEAGSSWGIDAVAANFLHWSTCIGCAETAYSRGGGVTVAVVDDGIDLTHSEFSGRVITLGAEAPSRTGSVYFMNSSGGATLLTAYAHKVYGASHYTVSVAGGAELILRSDNTAAGVPILTLTSGVNILKNSYAFPDTDHYAGFPYYEGLYPVYPFTPQHYAGDSHGSHVAGIIAGNLDGAGMAGVAPEAAILPIKFFTEGYHAVNLSEAYNYAIANNAFVINNSWYYSRPRAVKISLDSSAVLRTYEGAPVSDEFIWVRMPRTYYWDGSPHLTAVTPLTTGIDFAEYPLTVHQHAVNNTALIVFAQGNDGWNSETGEVPFCELADASPCWGHNAEGAGVITIAAADAPDLNSITAYGVYRGFTLTFANSGSTALTEVSANHTEFLKRFPLGDAALSMNWLNVVAVNSVNVIARFSNGCGDTKDFCLAAPGVDINSAVAERYEYDGSNQVTNTVYRDYERWNGTSMAAPHVSGAAAALKGLFPNLSPASVALILKDSAEGLGSCANVAKTIYCADEVYGHGMLNITAAASPTSALRIAGRSVSGFSAYALEDMRIDLSPAFGAAPWRHAAFRFGAADNYGRIFQSFMNFHDGAVVTKPIISGDFSVSGAGLHARYASPLRESPAAALAGAADRLHAADYQSRADADASGLGAAVFSQGGYQHRQINHGGVSFRYQSGDSRHAPLRRAVQDYWTPSFGQGAHYRFAYSHPWRQATGAASGATGLYYDYDEEDQSRQAGLRLSWGGSGWRLYAEGGALSEYGQMLGADFSGALAVERAQTKYRRIGGIWDIPAALINLQDDVSLHAGYMQTDTAAKTGGILRELSARGDQLSFGARWGNWEADYIQPLVIKSGRMRLSVIDGYSSADEDYSENDVVLDLAAGARRMHIASLMYKAESESVKGLEGALGLNYTKNSPAENYENDALALSAALRFVF